MQTKLHQLLGDNEVSVEFFVAKQIPGVRKNVNSKGCDKLNTVDLMQNMARY